MIGEPQIGQIDGQAPSRCSLDPGSRFRAARRGGARRRCGRRRLDPCRRDGRAFRAQHHHRPGRGEGAAAAHAQAVRRAPDDRALPIPTSRPLPKPAPTIITVHVEAGPHSTARCRRSARSARKPASRSIPAPPVETIANVHRSGRPDPGDVGQPGLRRPGIHCRQRSTRSRRLRAMVGGRDDRYRGRRRHYARHRAGGRRGPAPMCWSPAPPCSAAHNPDAYRANIAAIRGAAAMARGEAA